MRPCVSKSSLRRAAAASGERRPLLRRAGSVVSTLVFVLALVVVVLALVVVVLALIVFGLLDFVLVVLDLGLLFLGLGGFGLLVIALVVGVLALIVVVLTLVVGVLALVVRLFLGDRDVILPIGGESEGYRGRGPGRRRSMAVPQRLDRCRGARGERRRSDEERDQHDLGLQELLHDRSFRRVL